MSRKPKATKPAHRPVTLEAAAPAARPAGRGWALLLAAILLVSGLLGLAYSAATPFGENPDEAAHLQYVKVLAEERRLPALDLTRRRNVENDPHYESHQAPLYYLLSVPFYAAGKAVAGEAGGTQGPRLLSILIGLVGTFLVWRLARELVPGRPALWTAAAAFSAFLPMRLAVNASVSNDALAEVTSTLAILLMVRAVGGWWGVRPAVGLGLALAAALLAKSSAVLLLPPALLAVFVASRGSREGEPQEAQPAGLRQFFVTGAVVLGVVLGLSGWWFGRNQMLYGDPLGQKAFDWYFSDTWTWELFRDQFGFTYGRYLYTKVYRTSFASFWGAFGHLNPDRPELFMGAIGRGYPPKSWLYPILGWALTASLAGGGLYLIRRRLNGAALPPDQFARVGVVALHAVFVFAAFLRFNATYFQAQGRYLFPAIGCIALGLASGWLEWGRWAAKREASNVKGAPEASSTAELVLAGVLVAGMLSLALYALFGTIRPAFGTG